jgi:colanic acid/amylovoran biosynthesis protein
MKMKILIINQHTRNHGDEAAGLALIRGLYVKGYQDITISYNGSFQNWNDKCNIKFKDIKHLEPSPTKYSDKMIKAYLKAPFFLTKLGLFFFKDLRRELSIIKKSDYVISAPGGPNLGKYKDLRYLWRLFVAFKLKKKYALYSPSIGPFSMDDKAYLRLSTVVLKNATFISLRDNKSYEYAQNLNITFLKSIDTAFLECHDNAILPTEVNTLLPEKYIVVVPHQLFKWHRDFFKYDSETFDVLFKDIINKFVDNGHKIILLPQTFESRLNDEAYFQSLKLNNPYITVIPTTFPSDIQQKIIKGSEFVIGARYHTIVFSINNNVPFYCLSYEHKMIDMLKLLKQESKSIDIHKALLKPNEISEIIYQQYLARNEEIEKLSYAKEKAKEIAKDCFEKFLTNLKSS